MLVLDVGLNWLILVGSVNYWFGSVKIGKDQLNIGRDWLKFTSATKLFVP